MRVRYTDPIPNPNKADGGCAAEGDDARLSTAFIKKCGDIGEMHGRYTGDVRRYTGDIAEGDEAHSSRSTSSPTPTPTPHPDPYPYP